MGGFRFGQRGQDYFRSTTIRWRVGFTSNRNTQPRSSDDDRRNKSFVDHISASNTATANFTHITAHFCGGQPTLCAFTPNSPAAAERYPIARRTTVLSSGWRSGSAHVIITDHPLIDVGYRHPHDNSGIRVAGTLIVAVRLFRCGFHLHCFELLMVLARCYCGKLSPHHSVRPGGPAMLPPASGRTNLRGSRVRSSFTALHLPGLYSTQQLTGSPASSVFLN